MKVWVVFLSGPWYIESIFDSKEKAEKYVEKQRKLHKETRSYEIIERVVR